YVAHIFAWNGANVSSASLFNAAGNTAGSASFVKTITSLGGLVVGAGQYVALLHAVSGGPGYFQLAYETNPYAGGRFLYQQNGGDLSQLATHPFNHTNS